MTYGIERNGLLRDIVKELKETASLESTADYEGSLYIKRKVLNVQDIISWAASQGIEAEAFDDIDDLHVTIAYSTQPVRWNRIFPDMTVLTLENDERGIELFGKDKSILVLTINSNNLQRRFDSLIEEGCSWDFPDYKPHISITKEATADMNVMAYRGKVILGPELFDFIRED